MSADEREQKMAELSAQLLERERCESVLLEYAHENGVDVLPRIDMSPAAFLGVVVAKAVPVVPAEAVA